MLAEGRWGERGTPLPHDAGERLYQACYPALGPIGGCSDDDRGVADEMIARRRERDSLAALQDLVSMLRTARDERKAVLVVSDGWLLSRPNDALTRRLNCQVSTPQIGPGPGTGSTCRSTSSERQTPTASPGGAWR